MRHTTRRTNKHALLAVKHVLWGGGRWSGRLQAGGRTGIFPSNYVEVKPHDEPVTAEQGQNVAVLNGVAVTQAASDSQRSSDRKNNAAIFASEDSFAESADSYLPLCIGDAYRRLLHEIATIGVP